MEPDTTTQVEKDLRLALERLEVIRQTVDDIARSIYGERRSGFIGVVERVGMEEAARGAGDAAIRAEIDAFRARVDKLEKRFDRVIWTAIGVGLGSGGVGAVLANAIASLS